MSSAKHLRNEISNLIALLVNSQLAIDANAVVIREADGGQRVTWASAESPALSAGPFAAIEEYTRFLERRAYSVLLFDGAMLQLSFDVRGNAVHGHRLCYYPCPVDADPQLFLAEPVLDVVELHLESGTMYIRLRSPLRFDYSMTKNPPHPRSHVHLLWEHSRCPVYAPLSLGHFVRFVFSTFYPHLWANHAFIREWPVEQFGRAITPEHSRRLHLACLQ